MDKNALSEEAVNTYIDASVFEPTSATPKIHVNDTSPRTYLFGEKDWRCIVKNIAIYEEMDAIHTSLLHELQSKGEGES